MNHLDFCMRRSHFYRPQTKLGEDNVFSRVCMSVCLFIGGEWVGRGFIVQGPALPLSSQDPKSTPRTVPHPPAQGPNPRPVQTCSTWISPFRAPAPPPPNMLKLVHYEACTLDKWAVGILLDAFLLNLDYKIVLYIFYPSLTTGDIKDTSMNTFFGSY